MSHNPVHSNNFFENYTKIALSFGSAKLGLLAVRHPLHVIQMNKQAFPDLPNRVIASRIYQADGIKGFYKSTTVSILKIITAESYRGVLMIEVPKQIKQFLFSPWVSSYPIGSSLMTSLVATPIISVIDATLICPMTRFGTIQATLDKNQSLFTVYEKFIKGNVVRQLYRGYTPLLLQTCFLWGSFLMIDDVNKGALKKYTGKVSYSGIVLTSILGGSTQAAINSIPDTIRVQMQKHTSQNLNMRDTAKKIIRDHGVRSLFSTLPHRLALSIIGYGYKSVLRHFWSDKGSH